MPSYRVSDLLGEGKAKTPKPKTKVPNKEAWKPGLEAAVEGWKANVTTDLAEVERAFTRSRHTGTDGATRKATPRTIKNYQDNIDIFFRFLHSKGVPVWESITRTVVKEFVEHIMERVKKEELRPASAWATFRTLRALFYFVEKQEEHTWESFRKALPKIPKNTGRTWVPSPEMMKAFMEGFNQDTIWGFRDYVMATIMLDCGARIGELCNLGPSDILWDADMIVLLGKKQIVRKVSLSPTRTMPLLKQWDRVRERITKVDDRFFTTRNGGKLIVNEVSKSFRRNRIFTGVGKGSKGAERELITPHTFRHYFCTRYLVNGGTSHSLMQITGHEDITTLMIYVHLAAELSHVKEEHRRVSPLDSLYKDDTKKKRKMF